MMAQANSGSVTTAELRPMLASRVRDPFDSPDWLFELKWSGVRALAFISEGGVELRAQNGRDLTAAYPELQDLPLQLKGQSAILDGEIFALGKQGYPALELLRPRLNQLLQHREAQTPRGAVFYQISDVLYLDGMPLIHLPLWQRKNVLHARISPTRTAQAAQFVERDGRAFFDAVYEHRLEGVVAKRKEGLYQPGRRSRDWLEIPAQEVGSFVIAGYTFGGSRNRDAFQALLLGAYRDQELVYVGSATAGLATPEAWRTVRLLEGLHSSECPFAAPPAVNRFIYWCEPHLVCQVRLGERTIGGGFRFAVFVALRPDLAPADCQLEPEASEDAP